MLPQEICLDANVFVTAMIPEEEGHEAALEVVKTTERQGIPLFEPALVLFEFASALHRKMVSGELYLEEKIKLLDHFLRLPLLLQWQPAVMKETARLAADLGFKTVYDCAYLAVASLRVIPLITMDAEIVKKGRKIFGQIYSPKNFLQQIA